MQKAFMNEMTMRIFLRPKLSAMLPQKQAPTIMPMNMIELSHPLVSVFKSRSHWADGNMNDIEMTSISSEVLTRPQMASNMQWNLPQSHNSMARSKLATMGRVGGGSGALLCCLPTCASCALSPPAAPPAPTRSTSCCLPLLLDSGSQPRLSAAN